MQTLYQVLVIQCQVGHDPGGGGGRVGRRQRKYKDSGYPGYNGRKWRGDHQTDLDLGNTEFSRLCHQTVCWTDRGPELLSSRPVPSTNPCFLHGHCSKTRFCEATKLLPKKMIMLRKKQKKVSNS